MVMWPHGGSRAVTATMKLHDYSHIASREILCGKLPKLVSLLKTRLSQRSYVVRSDRLFGRSTVRWLGILLRTFPLRGSHAPRVGAGESRAEAATRRVESASATAAADGDRPDLLDRVGETLEELAEFLAGGAARDRGAVAPPGLQALLGMEESTPMGSARDWEGPAGSDTADEPRESAVGAPRIHGELLKLGLTVSQATVSKYMVRPRRPPSQAWRTFLKNHAPDLIALDFFTVPTVTFRVLFVLVVLTHSRRRLVHFIDLSISNGYIPRALR
jgi:hypothetical protein